jgi:MYXO-CTERM domain-containing protein
VLHTLAVVLLIALGDSINPSTVGPALYLGTTEHPRRQVSGFLIGLVAVNFLGGLVILLGPGQFLLSLVPKPTPTAKHVLQIVGGLALLGLAAVLWFRRRRLARHELPSLEGREGSSLALGAGIGTIELVTAFPYFAAIAVIAGSGIHLVAKVVTLALYNVVFVAPIGAILIALMVLRDRADEPLSRIRDWLQAHWPELSAGLAGVIGAAVLLLGIYGFAAPLGGYAP